MYNDKHPTVPAKLPDNSRAAAAQKLAERPLREMRGFYYPVPHRRLHPLGWRTKRYIKRRNLRRTTAQIAAVERIGTQWSMLPLAFGSLIVIVLLASVLVAFSAVVDATQQHFQQQVVTLADILPKDNLKMYDKQGSMIFQMTDQGLQTTEPLQNISPNLIHAEIAIEDQYFWSNPGYDITGIVRATLDNLTHGQIVSGGSTITQQVIKNAIVGSQDTAIRKLQELILAPDVTRRFTKQQILAMYLNTTYYGEQAYGAEAAAFTYFGLHDTAKATAAAQLDIAQAAMLAGIPSAPVGRDPFLYPHSAFLRVQEVLQQMRLQGYITIEQQRAAVFEVQGRHFLHRGVLPNTLAPHFANYALNELASVLHLKPGDLSRSGLLVSTTLDLPLQNQILKIAQRHIAEMAASHNMSDAAAVLIDFHNGAIRTLLGNIDPNNPQYGAFDVATDGYRQPGSSFKPFIYATAFEQGVSPGMPVFDTPVTIQMCCGLPSYTPHNYDQRFHGLVSFRYALQNSFNVPAVKLLLKTGVDQSLHTAQIMGINSYVGTPNYTMVLGTLGVHLLDETSAYGVFANGGVRIPPHAIDTVMDVQGHVIYHFAPIGKRVISKQIAYMMTNVLSDNKSRLFEFFDCNVLQLYSNTKQQCFAGNRGVVRPAAVKTRTSSDFRDNWTVGYTTDYVMGVWAGNNDNSPMVNVTGVDGAAPIWHDSMLLAEQGRPITDFVNPGGLVKKTITYPEGITTTDWYLQ
ncbi:MAG TPA: transglycosylase domain-containing protein [Ktedonobacteraceae bacterium]|nr:transglycosylase domain-containing protein [Ktedonobacteraceae bacterium]